MNHLPNISSEPNCIRAQNLNDSLQENVINTLANLNHYCNKEEVDFDQAVRAAKSMAQTE